jgi:pyruvyltransferase
MIKIVHWKCRRNNWGDGIAPFIANKLTNKKIESITGTEGGNQIRYTVTGSINQWLTNDNTIIWGTGFISATSELKITPRKICAVRGPLTRDKFIKAGIDCPEVYGDPALLMPRFYKPKISKKFKYGIIPHYIDYNHDWVKKYHNDPNVKIIDITHSSESELFTHRFIDEILECEIIFSSSLHGLIAADAYNVPSYWLELSDKVVGNGFKFEDYFRSVNRPLNSPIRPLISDDINSFHTYEYNININLDKLISACPFK